MPRISRYIWSFFALSTGSLASAQSSVTLFGVMDAGVSRYMVRSNAWGWLRSHGQPRYLGVVTIGVIWAKPFWVFVPLKIWVLECLPACGWKRL